MVVEGMCHNACFLIVIVLFSEGDREGKEEGGGEEWGRKEAKD